MKHIPIILTTIHGGFSLLLIGISSAMPLGGTGGGIGYITALAAFVINLPGVLTIKQFFTSSPKHRSLSTWVVSAGMILITDIYLFLFLTFIFWMIGRTRNLAKKRVRATVLPQR